MPHFVETRDIGRVFNGSDRSVKTLDTVSIHIDEGEIFGLLGPNGAGKTTLIKILTTLLLPTEGEARVGGFDAAKEVHKVVNRV